MGSILVIQLSKNLPDVKELANLIPYETTKIYADNEKTILAELHKEENRTPIDIENISDTLQATVIALEDTDFYQHHGINLKGLLRAFVKDVMAGSFVEGGSTITQQLARNIYLSKQKKIKRKIEEIILAIQIERHYSKTEILEWYLNQVYWGHNAYGIESSAQLYFNKHALDLSLAESAMLCGLLKGPELFSPFKNFPRSKKRQKTVLNRMAQLGLITKEQARNAYDQELVLATRKKFKYKAPFFTEYIVQQLVDMYGEEITYTSGMKVYTTLNYEMQEAANKIVQKYVDYAANPPKWVNAHYKVPSLNMSQAAILSLEPSTGYIKVMQGGVDFQKNMFNRCTQAKRQPGSAFKPFVYLTALSKGFSPGTYIDDSPVTFNTIEGPYAPQNYSLKYRGPLPIRKALEKSVNVVAIKLNDLCGPKSVVKTARQLGITSPLKPILSLPLGALEVTMLELSSVYGVFANQGNRVEPTGITKITDRDGNILYEHEVREKNVFDKDKIAALVEMMTGVVKYGTGRAANIPRPVAGKTGTTSDYRDAWFIGFIPQMVTACWVGNDDNTPMHKMTGGWIPATMWKEFMTKAIEIGSMPPQRFSYARNLVERKINLKTGKLASTFTPKELIRSEKFWRDSIPETDTGGSYIGKTEEAQKENESSLLDFFKR